MARPRNRGAVVLARHADRRDAIAEAVSVANAAHQARGEGDAEKPVGHHHGGVVWSSSDIFRRIHAVSRRRASLYRAFRFCDRSADLLVRFRHAREVAGALPIAEQAAPASRFQPHRTGRPPRTNSPRRRTVRRTSDIVERDFLQVFDLLVGGAHVARIAARVGFQVALELVTGERLGLGPGGFEAHQARLRAGSNSLSGKEGSRRSRQPAAKRRGGWPLPFRYWRRRRSRRRPRSVAPLIGPSHPGSAGAFCSWCRASTGCPPSPPPLPFPPAIFRRRSGCRLRVNRAAAGFLGRSRSVIPFCSLVPLVRASILAGAGLNTSPAETARRPCNP